MRILAAIDSFKGSLTSLQAGYAVKEAVEELKMDAQVSVCPLADGGEGDGRRMIGKNQNFPKHHPRG